MHSAKNTPKCLQHNTLPCRDVVLALMQMLPVLQHQTEGLPATLAQRYASTSKEVQNKLLENVSAFVEGLNCSHAVLMVTSRMLTLSSPDQHKMHSCLAVHALKPSEHSRLGVCALQLRLLPGLCLPAPDNETGAALDKVWAREVSGIRSLAKHLLQLKHEQEMALW